MGENEKVEDLKEEVKELREELEKVKNRKTGEAREKEVGEIQDQIRDAVDNSDAKFSRRDFLKALGGGTAAAGAMAMLPGVAGFNFKDDSSFKFGNLSSQDTNFEVGTQGDLNLHGNDITNTGAVNAETVDTGSLHTGQAQIDERLDYPALTSGTFNDSKQVSGFAVYVDKHVNLGRIFSVQDDYYDPPYDTANDMAGTQPSGEIKLAWDGYLYYVDEGPLTVRRIDYDTVVSGSGGTGTTVLTGQSGSGLQARNGRWVSAFNVDPDTGVMLIGEEDPDNSDAKIYKSTDGATWSEVQQFTQSDIKEVHGLAPDPFVDGQWVATLGDSGGGASDATSEFAVSTDDGETWTHKNWHYQNTSNHAVGMDFSEDYIYFSDDGATFHGPWVVDRKTEKTALVFRENPERKFRGYADTLLNFGVIHDPDTGVTYFTGVSSYNRVNAAGYETNLIYYARGLGDTPQLLTATNEPQRFFAADGYIVMGARLHPELKQEGI